MTNSDLLTSDNFDVTSDLADLKESQNLLLGKSNTHFKETKAPSFNFIFFKRFKEQN